MRSTSRRTRLPNTAGARATPRLRFFAGKGGVGKTTSAAAFAVAAATAGDEVLVVSTDPAHSLGDALGVRLGSQPRRVRGVAHLSGAELDADAALDRWLGERRELLQTILLRGTYLDREDVERFLALSLPGVDELMGLLELSRLSKAGAWDLVVVDTAPTGHTLRLLDMPDTLRQIAGVLDDMQAKHRFLGQSLGRGHRADAADALIAEIESDARVVAEELRDAKRTGFSWVLLPEVLSLEEAKDGVAALERDQLPVTDIVVNRVTPPPPGPCALCSARRRSEADVLAAAHAAFAGRAVRPVDAEETEPRGRTALLRLGRRLTGPARTARRGPRVRKAPARRPSRSARRVPAKAPPWWVSALAPPTVRLLMFGGKGGVGKTTAAASAALALVRAGRPDVLLLSTDPAHSLADVLATPLGDDERRVPGVPDALRARELDAERALAAARERYRGAVDALFDRLRGGSRLDPAYDRAVIQDLMDLAPPGIDELFALVAVTGALVGKTAARTVVVDTAPTGHALRLLALPAAAREWVQALLAVLLKYREVVGLGTVAQELVDVARKLRELEALLRDPARTAFVAVSQAAELPRRETERLLEELRGLRVPVRGLLVNAVTPPGCARCRRAARREAGERARLSRVWRSLTAGKAPMILAPLIAPPPRGPIALSSWSETWRPAQPAAQDPP